MFQDLQIPNEFLPSDPRFGCGPSLIPVQYVEALAKTGNHLLGTSHRMSAVRNLVGEVVKGFKEYYKLPKGYEVVFGNGGATFLFDMIPLGMVREKVVHFTCGEFSQKWFKSSKSIPWIKAQEVAFEYGKGVRPHDVPDADMLCFTLNETSTGVQFTDYFRPQNPEALVVVDATSGAGQVPCDMSKIDMYFFSPQKVFGSEGGLWVAFMNEKAIKRANEIAEIKSRYIPPIMDFKAAIENSLKNQTYNTPSISTFFFINEQLKVMNALGQEKVVAMAQEKADLIYDWAEKKSYLSPFIQEKKDRSLAVATIDVDPKVSVDELLEVLAKRKIVYGIDSYRKLGRNQFRISLFHNISLNNLEKLTKLLSFAIEKALS